MTATAGVIYRLQWKRDGWSKTNSSLHMSRRGAFAAAAKLNHATQRYELKPLTELVVQEGVVNWGAIIPLPEDLHTLKQPLVHGAVLTGEWTADLVAVRERMLSPAMGYSEAECTIEKVRAFADRVKEQE